MMMESRFLAWVADDATISKWGRGRDWRAGPALGQELKAICPASWPLL
jgi:hypothetical protein